MEKKLLSVLLAFQSYVREVAKCQPAAYLSEKEASQTASVLCAVPAREFTSPLTFQGLLSGRWQRESILLVKMCKCLTCYENILNRDCLSPTPPPPAPPSCQHLRPSEF